MSRRVFGAGSGSSCGLHGGSRGPFCGSKGKAIGSGSVIVAWLFGTELLFES